mmetsp:Transcript_2208/g.6577  ORF Transcript_2208/g.6577 Transcript_2208/m.6577 type:complete len:241 (+) Transcript_2208:116-838(+)
MLSQGFVPGIMISSITTRSASSRPTPSSSPTALITQSRLLISGASAGAASDVSGASRPGAASSPASALGSESSTRASPRHATRSVNALTGRTASGRRRTTVCREPTREKGNSNVLSSPSKRAETGYFSGPSNVSFAKQSRRMRSSAASGSGRMPLGRCASQTFTRNVTRRPASAPSTRGAACRWRPSKTRWRPALGGHMAPEAAGSASMAPENVSGRFSKTTVGAPPSVRYVTVDSCGKT